MIFEKRIKAYNRFGLNEYYANLDAFSRYLILVNETFKDEIEDSLIVIYNEALIEHIPTYLFNVNADLKAFLTILEQGEINEISIENPKAELIGFLWSRFFLQLYYFFGGWKVYKSQNLNTSRIQEIWDSFIQELEEFDLDEMITLLYSFKEFLLGDHQNKEEVVNSVDLLFLNYYHKGLESDFSSFL